MQRQVAPNSRHSVVNVGIGDSTTRERLDRKVQERRDAILVANQALEVRLYRRLSRYRRLHDTVVGSATAFVCALLSYCWLGDVRTSVLCAALGVVCGWTLAPFAVRPLFFVAAEAWTQRVVRRFGSLALFFYEEVNLEQCCSLEGGDKVLSLYEQMQAEGGVVTIYFAYDSVGLCLYDRRTKTQASREFVLVSCKQEEE